MRIRLTLLASLLVLVASSAIVVGLSTQDAELPSVEVYKSPT